MSLYPHSIREINQLPEPDKQKIYLSLVPKWVYQEYQINPETHMTAYGKKAIHFRYPQGSRAVELSIRRQARDIDPIFYLNMADTFNNQILVLLVVINDPDSERFNVDFDNEGNPTHLGTVGRNLAAEAAALKAGLAPGQVRSGLRVFRNLVPIFENFISNMGHQMFFIEPFAYHNAIVFERFGFNYVQGLNQMKYIHQEFQPDGELFQKLNGDSVFRMKGAEKTIRGRSWAIHDGILGHPFTGFQMYKHIGKSADICTFPDGIW